MYENLKLVIVEDDKALNDLICRRLKREGHSPVGFQNAADAIKFLSEEEANLLITDMNLPDLSGEELVSELKRNNINIPFVVVTGEGSEMLAVRMLKSGAKDYLVKNSALLDSLPSKVEMIWNEVQLTSLLEKAKNKIHIQNARLSAINEFSPDGILAVSRFGEIQTFNKTLYEICGVDPNYNFDDADEFLSFLAEKVEEPENFASVVNSLSPDCSGIIFNDIKIADKYYELAVAPMHDASGEFSGRIWYFADITRHKLAAEEMKKAKQEADANAKMRSQFFAVVSHDVKTPLNSIVGFIGLLEDSGLSEAQMEYVKAIRSSGDHLLQLINDILDFTRIEHGAVELDMTELSLRDMLTECIYNFKPAAAEKGLDLNLTLAENIPDILVTDQLRVRQILINLLGNSVKFTENGSITLSAEVKDNILHLAVADTGIGISDDAQRNLFTPFTQADASVTQKYGGTGLGLAISKQLAQLLGGDLTLESKLGEGSRFTLLLPVE